MSDADDAMSRAKRAAFKLMVGDKVGGGDGRTYTVRTPRVDDVAEALLAFAASERDAAREAGEGWKPIETAPRDGTAFIGRALNASGRWMYPWLYRHEGKVYSQFQEHLNGEWRNCTSSPTFWLPSSITDPATTPSPDASPSPEAPATKPDQTSDGWIVASGDGKRWRTWKDGWSAWTDEREQATRYHRREDAEAVHREDEDAWLIQPYRAALTDPMGGVTETGGARQFIATLVDAAEAIAWQAGVGGRETAGAIVSYLATSPDELEPFFTGKLSPIDFAGDWMRGGCLSWHGADGKVWTPEAAAAARTAFAASERDAAREAGEGDYRLTEKLLQFVLRCSSSNPASLGSAVNDAESLLIGFGIEPRERGVFWHTDAADLRDARARLAVFRRDRPSPEAPATKPDPSAGERVERMREALEAIDGEAPKNEPPAWPTVGFQPSLDPEQDDGNDIVCAGFDEGVVRGRWEAANIARAALTDPMGGVTETVKIPEGWKLVPVEPTMQMLNAAIDTDSYKLGDISPLGFRCSPQTMFERCWSAMLAASPSSPVSRMEEGS